ncbi:unnamed protein product [Orchesella dallaii]|uniref:Ig-like domain-containing protein n=1 Tax=Orchesella dallaii TaxID=48710 RepID=A0ABP1QSD4_9HEXA
MLNKGKCQGPNALCTCMSQSILEDFGEILLSSARLRSREPTVVFERINGFNCQNFVPLPEYLLIHMPARVNSLDLRQRRLYRNKRSTYLTTDVFNSQPYDSKSRSKRQISFGHGYLTPEELETVRAHISETSAHHYVPLGSQITLPCVSDEEELYGVSKYVWTHQNGRPITAPLVRIDPSKGDLTFDVVRLADTGIYVCAVTNEDENYAQETKSFRTQLDVIAAPMMWLRIGITYETDRCRHNELLLIQNAIPDWVQKYVCHFCPVRNVSVTCVADQGEQKGTRDGPRFVQITLALSTVGLESKLSSWNHNSDLCRTECVEAMHFKILNVFSSSLRNLFSLQILVEPEEGKTSQYLPIPNTWDDDQATGCPAGFFYNFKICFPCGAGEYSPHGKAECILCEQGFFQPNPGSSACFSCPRGHSTLQEGSLTQAQCVLETVKVSLEFAKFHWIIVGCVLGVLLILILLIVCCCPNSCLGKCLRCAGCSGGNSSKEEHSGSREHLIVDNTSDFDEPRQNHHKKDIETNHGYSHGRPKRHSKRISYNNHDEDEGTAYYSTREHGQVTYNQRENPPDMVASRSKTFRTNHSISTPHVQQNVRKTKGKYAFQSNRDEHEPPLQTRRSFYDTLQVFQKQSTRSNLHAVPDTPPPLKREETRHVVNGKRLASHHSAPHFQTPESETESERYRRSGRNKYCDTDQNYKMGNILNKSKSLAKKLAERGRKLVVNQRFPSKTRWKSKNVNSIGDTNVCRQCTSSHFQTGSDERIKHFRRGVVTAQNYYQHGFQPSAWASPNRSPFVSSTMFEPQKAASFPLNHYSSHNYGMSNVKSLLKTYKQFLKLYAFDFIDTYNRDSIIPSQSIQQPHQHSYYNAAASQNQPTAAMYSGYYYVQDKEPHQTPHHHRAPHNFAPTSTPHFSSLSNHYHQLQQHVQPHASPSYHHPRPVLPPHTRFPSSSSSPAHTETYNEAVDLFSEVVRKLEKETGILQPGSKYLLAPLPNSIPNAPSSATGIQPHHLDHIMGPEFLQRAQKLYSKIIHEQNQRLRQPQGAHKHHNPHSQGYLSGGTLNRNIYGLGRPSYYPRNNMIVDSLNPSSSLMDTVKALEISVPNRRSEPKEELMLTAESVNIPSTSMTIPSPTSIAMDDIKTETELLFPTELEQERYRKKVASVKNNNFVEHPLPFEEYEGLIKDIL